MSETRMWKRNAAVLGGCLILGLTACSSSDDDPDAKDDASSSDSAASDGASDGPEEDSTDEGSSQASDPQTTSDPTKGGGWKFLPECEELSRSIVDGEGIVDIEQVDGRACFFTLGDPVIGRQLVWVARGGGGWPETFKAKQINDKWVEVLDPDLEDYSSSVSEIDAPPDWSYGFRIDEKIGKTERSSYRLLAFAKNGDLLNCHTSVSDVDPDAFRSWCDEVLTAVQP